MFVICKYKSLSTFVVWNTEAWTLYLNISFCFFQEEKNKRLEEWVNDDRTDHSAAPLKSFSSCASLNTFRQGFAKKCQQLSGYSSARRQWWRWATCAAVVLISCRYSLNLDVDLVPSGRAPEVRGGVQALWMIIVPQRGGDSMTRSVSPPNARWASTSVLNDSHWHNLRY